MPNPFELTDQERKGLLYGSLLSAALTAATAASKGQNILPSVLSGATAGIGSYGGGMERVFGYREAQSAEKRRLAQEARQQRAFEQEQSLFPLQRQELEAKIAHIPEQEAFMRWQRENYPQKKTPPLPKKQPNKQLPKPPIPALEGLGLDTLLYKALPNIATQRPVQPKSLWERIFGGGGQGKTTPSTKTPVKSLYKEGEIADNPNTGETLIYQNGKWHPYK